LINWFDSDLYKFDWDHIYIFTCSQLLKATKHAYGVCILNCVYYLLALLEQSLCSLRSGSAY